MTLIRVFRGAWRTVDDADLVVTDDQHATEVGTGGAPLVFVQPTPASTWTIAHGLGHEPQVTVITADGTRVGIFGCIYTDPNTVTLTFKPPLAGQALLS